VLLSVAKESETQFGVFQRETEIRDLRVTFEITKSKKKHPNSCTVSIYNMNEDSRALFQHKPTKLSISAGYDDAPRLLFTGSMTWSETVQKGVDIVTTAIIGDGARPFRGATVSRSFAPGTQVITAVLYVIKAMNMVAPENLANDPSLRSKFQAGDTVHGKCSAELSRLLEPYGYEWSIQDGRLQALRENEALVDETVISENILNTLEFGPPSETTKKKKKPILNIPMVLNPELKIGQKVRVEGLRIKGRFKIDELTHSGDTHGQNWMTTAQAIQI